MFTLGLFLKKSVKIRKMTGIKNKIRFNILEESSNYLPSDGTSTKV